MVAPLTIESVRQRLTERAPGWVLLDDIYKGNRHDMHFICSEGHDVIATWGNVAKGMRCAICSGVSKPKIEDIKDYISNKFPTYILLTNQYENAMTKLNIQCNKGHIWEITWSNIKKAKKCNICTERQGTNRNLEDAKQVLVRAGNKYKIVEDVEYFGSKMKLLVQCSKGHPPFMSFLSTLVSNRENCKECQIDNKSNIQGIKEWAATHAPGYTILNKTHVFTKDKLDMICTKGHSVQMKVADFKSDVRCRICRIEESKLTFEEVKQRIFTLEPEYTLVSTEYIDSSVKLEMICKHKDKHTCFINAQDFVHSGVRCNRCLNYKTEYKCRDILERVLKNKFIKFRPPWMINPKTGKRLELDGYCEELSLAFEYDGPQHFKATEWSGHKATPEERLADQLYKDKIKDLACIENNIILIRIPFTKSRNLEYFIKSELDRLGIKYDS